jgi:formylglycine-generating enzyme required for sulfatase activity
MSEIAPAKRIALVTNALTGLELSGGNRDVAMVYSLLTDPTLGSCSTDSPPPIHQCENRYRFEQVLGTLISNWKVADQLILYFSGHGEIRGGTYCLKIGTTDDDYLPFDNIVNELSSHNVTRAIIMLDTCFSGAATRIKTDSAIKSVIELPKLSKGIAILASSQPSEISHELPDGSSSVFTGLLCEGIRSGLGNNSTIDGLISISDIVEFIGSRLEKDDRFAKISQKPVYTINAADRSIWISRNISGGTTEEKLKQAPLITSFDELKLWYEKTEQNSPDRLPCPAASLEDLDWDLIHVFYTKIHKKAATNIDKDNILRQLQLYSPVSHQGNKCLHTSAVLCFTKRPDLIIPQAKSTFFIGNLEDKEFVREDINGPLSEQVVQLIKIIVENLDTVSYISKTGLREQRLEIDQDLIRELISNAITHRDYNQSGNVTVMLKPDVLEIKNPGKFPDDFSWVSIFEKGSFGSRPINPAISHYLSHLLAFEGVGRGLAIIKKYIDSNGPDSIALTEYPGPFTCISILRHKQKAQLDTVVSGNNTINLGSFVAPPDLEKLRTDYLSHLRRAYHALDFRGIQQLESFSRELPLENIYVPLLARPESLEGDIWERSQRLAGRMVKSDKIPEESLAPLEKRENRPIHVEEALRGQSRLVVLGDPGSGKSTLLKYLTLRLAAEADAPLPILVPLNAYARALQQSDVSLQAFLSRYYAGIAQGVANLSPLFNAAIEKGQSIILLDGLDEVQEGRSHLVNKVEAFAADVVEKGNKLIVTSRIVGYNDAPLSSKWKLYTLLDFDQEAIEAFVSKWCLTFETTTLGDTPEARRAAEIERRALLDAINANPGVARLAANPLLLTILALIKRQGVLLPNRRVELYELYLETLLSSWNRARSLDKQPVGPDLNPNETLLTLGSLALWLRQENPTAGVVPEEALLSELTRQYMSDDWGLKRGPASEKAHEFLESVRRYSNLLVERGPKLYGFLHLTFEEILAAYGIYQRGQLEIENGLAIIREHLIDPAWRETILLAVGVWGLANKQPRVAGEVVRAILKMDCTGMYVGQNILIAGACLEDVGGEGLGRVAVEEVITALTETSKNRSLPPATQRDAGFSLGRLSSINKTFLTSIRPDIDSWVSIPAGIFLYGDEKQKISVKEPIVVAKYPVTNMQYRRFIEAGGYDRREFWSNDGWAWRKGKWETNTPDFLRSLLENRPVEKRNEPFYWLHPKWNNPLAPVVAVSWFESEAYANWLSKDLGKQVRLPTELEWELSSRGTDGREYPWGDKFDRNKLNCAEFWAGVENLTDPDIWNKWFKEGEEIASTTIVGQFPEGQSPYGIQDLSGCIWEWTNSWYEKGRKNRVVRGGAWPNNCADARSYYRNSYYPDLYSLNVGFRLISSDLINPNL